MCVPLHNRGEGENRDLAGYQVGLAHFAFVTHNLDALVDRLDIVLTAGTLDSATRQAIENVLVDIDDANQRARIAIYMFLLSSDYAVRQ